MQDEQGRLLYRSPSELDDFAPFFNILSDKSLKFPRGHSRRLAAGLSETTQKNRIAERRVNRFVERGDDVWWCTSGRDEAVPYHCLEPLARSRRSQEYPARIPIVLADVTPSALTLPDCTMPNALVILSNNT